MSVLHYDCSVYFSAKLVLVIYVGNLPLGAICMICEKECSVKLGLVDFQCCWCQSCVHSECQKHVKDVRIIIT